MDEDVNLIVDLDFDHDKSLIYINLFIKDFLI